MMKKQTELTFVMTLNAESLDTLLEPYEGTSILNSNQTKEVKIRSLRTKIATRMDIYKNWLLIVDNVENLKLVAKLLLKRTRWNDGQVLITTQE